MDDASAASGPRSAGGSGPAPATGPLAGAEWPARLADLVEAVVTALHDKVVRPLLIVARAVVFGLVVAAMALAIAVLSSIAVVRLLDTYAFGRRVWASDLVVGGFFTLVGLLAWSRRRAGHAEER
jgi:hypothetical protein